MQVYYDGKHSVNFWDPKIDPQFDSEHNPWKNTWTDFHLIPASRPVISPPPVKKSSIEVIGANELIDLTEVPRGFPTYSNRTGSLEFYVDNSDPSYDWAAAYHEVKRYFHGRWLRMYLDDDGSSYYEGRFEINNWKTGKSNSQITLDYDLNPFALSMFSTLEEWLWDPFDFLTMEIPGSAQELFRNLTVPEGQTSASVYYNSDVIGAMPVIPTLYVADSDENGMSIQIYNTYSGKWFEPVTVTNNIGTTGFRDPLLVFSTPSPGSGIWVFYSGVGKLSIDFRPGRL